MKISRRQFVKAMAAMSAASMLAACGGSSDSGSSGGKKALTFQIWDVAQKEGMEAMCAAYTQQHPEVSIEVQVTSWNEYWTKLEAAATSNQMPDIFWMHTNELLKYADNGMLADCSDIVEKDKFSEVSLSNAMGSNGTLYAVPKDKDTVGLVYNKEMFDAAGVAYPDENWTWDDLVSASEKIYAATGKYGYMAYADDQLGYWNFVYQAGGYILNEDKTKAGFTQPATEKAMKFYIGLQQNDWCPDQTYFAETAPALHSSPRRAQCSWKAIGTSLPSCRTTPKWWASGMWLFCPSAPTRKAEMAVPPSPTVCATRLLPATKIWIP